MMKDTHLAAEDFFIDPCEESIEQILAFIEDDMSRCLIREVLERLAEMLFDMGF